MTPAPAPSTPHDHPHAARRGLLSRLFTRLAAPRKTLTAMMALTLAAGVAMPDDAMAARKKRTAAPAGPTPASIVIDVDNNRVLNEFNATRRIHPASTTKMMTAYLVFEAIQSGRLRADQHLTVSANAAAQPRTNLALRAGSTITVDQALRGLMVHSANDAAVVLGEAVAGNRAAFARQMTAKARALGMTNSTFFNANGLGDPSQLVTAQDMARLLIAVQRDYPALYATYFGVRDFSYNGGSWTNTNRLLGSEQCPGITGGKTGYIRAAGTNIVVMAERNNRRVVVGVFGRATGAIRNNLTCNLVNFAYFKMLRDPNATYDSNRQYEVIMPPAPATTPAPTPAVPQPVPAPHGNDPFGLPRTSTDPFAVPRAPWPEAAAVPSQHWQGTLTPTTRYSLRFDR